MQFADIKNNIALRKIFGNEQKTALINDSFLNKRYKQASARREKVSQLKKAQGLTPFDYYTQQIGSALKRSLIAAGIAAALTLATPTQAQLFTLLTGASNPFDGVDIGSRSAPTFVDIDNDGDQDAFVGGFTGIIYYYKNTGTAAAPTFTEQLGASSPFNAVDVGNYSTPTFVDIDNDGDQDAFIGEFTGILYYYKNTGTTESPTFTEQLGVSNPFDGVDVGSDPIPTFVDIDNDGDQDAFLGGSTGIIYYYKNTGTAEAPVFTEQLGASNPFDGVGVGSRSAPIFVDIDSDSDQDAFVGRSTGTIKYYKNTGTAPVPAFTEQLGTSNPFDGVDVGSNPIPTFVDIDNDGYQDAFIGESAGTIYYYKNETALPVELVSFSGQNTERGNLLTWAVASEVNNNGFEVEKSNDGVLFEKIGFVEGLGSSSQVKNYSFMDASPFIGSMHVIYYRLRQLDYDEGFEYSKIISFRNDKENMSIRIYPTTTSDILMIDHNGSVVDKVMVINQVGQTVLTDQQVNSVNMSTLPSGLYFVLAQVAQIKVVVNVFKQ